MIEKNIDQIKIFDFRSGLANLEKNANGLFCLKVKTFLLLNYYKAGAVALANIFCWAVALLYAQMASKSVTFSMPFFINAVHSQASLSACLISGCFVFNYQNLCPF